MGIIADDFTGALDGGGLSRRCRHLLPGACSLRPPLVRWRARDRRRDSDTHGPGHGCAGRASARMADAFVSAGYARLAYKACATFEFDGSREHRSGRGLPGGPPGAAAGADERGFSALRHDGAPRLSVLPRPAGVGIDQALRPFDADVRSRSGPLPFAPDTAPHRADRPCDAAKGSAGCARGGRCADGGRATATSSSTPRTTATSRSPPSSLRQGPASSPRAIL